MNTIAQDTPPDTLVTQIRAYYDSLDHSSMQTDDLFNRGFVVLNNLEEWKEGAPVITDLQKWEHLYGAVQQSDINLQTQFPHIDTLKKENTINEFGSSTVAMAIVNFNGDYLTHDTIQKMEEKGIPPGYTQLQLFSGTVLHQTVYDQEVSFKWTPGFYFSNLSTNFTLEVNFGDGRGYRAIDTSNAQTYSVTYQSVGEKSIRFRYIANKDTFISYSHIAVSSLDAEMPTDTGTIVVEDTTSSGKRSTNNYNLSRAEYKYHEGVDNELDKPVIIAEGYNVGGIKSLSDLKSKWDDRINRLRNHGYDVYTLGYLNPDRDLRLNADIIKKLIHKINSDPDKVGNYEGIYFGESMSGILGRIALKEMEDNNYDHKIGLFVPYDSPMRGANIPKGIQWAFHDAYWGLGPGVISATYLVEIIEAIFGADIPIVDLYQQLNSTAAKQMIIRHYQGSTVYNDFQTYLNNLGYPSDSRNVSFVNGSDDASFQKNVTLGDQIFSQTLFLGVSLVDLKAWYSETNVTGQKVSRVNSYNFVQLWLSFSQKRHEDFNQQPLDNAPGGNYDYGFNQGPINVDLKFDFVPSVSAIDLSQSVFDNGTLDDFNKNEVALINNNDIPLDDVYADVFNDGHTFYEFFYNPEFEDQEIMYDHMYLQNRTIGRDRDFEAEHTVTLGRDVQPASFTDHPFNPTLDKQINTGDFVVSSGTNTLIEAGESITLEPGTKLQTGSDVTLRIDPDNPVDKMGPQRTIPAPGISGSKTICGETTYRAATSIENATATTKWRLTGENTDLSGTGEQFTTPADLPTGQYTLYCTTGKGSSSATRSKIVVMPSDERCRLIEELDKNVEDDTVSASASVIYPNPTGNKVTIEFQNQEKPKRVTLKDAIGKNVINTKRVEGRMYELDFSNLPDGLYLVEVQTRNDVEVHKVVKH